MNFNTSRRCKCPRAGEMLESWLLPSRSWTSSLRFPISFGSSVKKLLDKSRILSLRSRSSILLANATFEGRTRIGEVRQDSCHKGRALPKMQHFSAQMEGHWWESGDCNPAGLSWVSSKEAGPRETALLQVKTFHISAIFVNIGDGQTNLYIIILSPTVTLFTTYWNSYDNHPLVGGDLDLI